MNIVIGSFFVNVQEMENKRRIVYVINNYYQIRGARMGQIKKAVWRRKKTLADFKQPATCVECNKHKEIYMSYYCEACYRKILRDKLDGLGE